jgi:hypothetical protein
VGRALVLIIFIVVIFTTFVLEIAWAFMFVRLAILGHCQQWQRMLGIAVTYIIVPSQCFIDISRRKFVELLVVAKDDDCDIDGT